MKKILFLLVAAVGMLLLSCNSIDSQISKYEKACKAGDYSKAVEIASELSKHTNEFTAEQSQRILNAAMDCANSQIDLGGGGSSDGYTSGDSYSSGAADFSSSKTPAEVDALINELDGMLNRLSKFKVDNDEYEALADQIDDLLDVLSDCDLTPAQERRIEKLEDRFDDIDLAIESTLNSATKAISSLDDDDDDWDF